jgi:hypothetical protein
MRTSYLLDPDNRVIATGGDWDAFAEENDGGAARADTVLGRPLLGFVAGASPRRFLADLLRACRIRGTVFETLVRCDAPWERRLFGMRVEPRGEGRLSVIHDLRSAERLAPPPLVFGHGPGARCAMCGAVLEDGRWVDPFEAPMRRHAYDTDAVCPACRGAARRALGAAEAA